MGEKVITIICEGQVVKDVDFIYNYGITAEHLEELKQSGLKDGFFMYGDEYKFHLIYPKGTKKKYKKRNPKKVKLKNIPKIDIPILNGNKRFIFTHKIDFKEKMKKNQCHLFVKVDDKEYKLDLFCAAMEMSRVHMIKSIENSETFKLNGVDVTIVRHKIKRILYNLRNDKSGKEYNHIQRSTVMDKTKSSEAIIQGLNEKNPIKIFKHYTIERIQA
jgi:hypothetical protein